MQCSSNRGIKETNSSNIGEPLKANCILGLSGSMERLIAQAYDTDSLRSTMLKHEEIFKQQVNELHHLYRVQKELMTELENKHQKNLHPFSGEAAMPAAAAAETTSRIWSSPSASKDTTSNPCRKIAGQGSAPERRSADNKRFGLEQRAEDHTPQGGGRGNTEEGGPVSCPDDGIEVELTLSIGSSSDKNKRKSAHWLHHSSDSGDGRKHLPAQSIGPEKGEEPMSPPSFQSEQDMN